MKLAACKYSSHPHCRPPYGGRGLKFKVHFVDEACVASPSVWGAWIEIAVSSNSSSVALSPSVWGAWIEISICLIYTRYEHVALRMGGVD